MDDRKPLILVIGYGNPGRLDDGLGPALAKAVEDWNLPQVHVDISYQLSVEDSHAASVHDFVIFVDAAVSGTDEFHFRELSPEVSMSHTSHHLDPASVLGLAHALFNSNCRGYELGIRGYAFNDFGEKLSVGAGENLQAALAFLKPLLNDGMSQLDQSSETLTSKRI